jgi:hypothetical protein
VFRARFEGEPLNGIELRFAAFSVRGEAVVTRIGIEGGAIYALSAHLRDAIGEAGEARLTVDLRPTLSVPDLEKALSKANARQSTANMLRKAAKLAPVGAGLLQEAALQSGQNLRAMSPSALAILIKGVPVRLTAPAPIERAISTAGGVSLDAIDGQFMLQAKPGVFIAGEMLDWEAPTGGFLLQACFSTGAAAGKGALSWLNRPR